MCGLVERARGGAAQHVEHEAEAEALVAGEREHRAGERRRGIGVGAPSGPMPQPAGIGRPARWCRITLPCATSLVAMSSVGATVPAGAGAAIASGFVPSSGPEGADGRHAGIAVAERDADHAARGGELRVVRRRAVVARVAHEHDGGAGRRGPLAAQAHGEGADVRAEAVVAVDHRQRREVDDHLGRGVADGRAGAQARQVEVQEDDAVGVQPAHARVDEAARRVARRRRSGPGGLEDPPCPVLERLRTDHAGRPSASASGSPPG